MSADLLGPILVALAGLLGIGCGLRITRDSERLVVFRLGRLLRLAGPGLSLHIPFIDRALRVNLDEAVPEWRSLTPEQLLQRLAPYLRRPAPPR